MSAINVKVEGYGAIQRKLPSQITLNYPSEVLVSDVLEQIIDEYPDSQTALDRCACAIGEDIVPRQTILKTDCTLVLLSPVAGG